MPCSKALYMIQRQDSRLPITGWLSYHPGQDEPLNLEQPAGIKSADIFGMGNRAVYLGYEAIRISTAILIALQQCVLLQSLGVDCHHDYNFKSGLSVIISSTKDFGFLNNLLFRLTVSPSSAAASITKWTQFCLFKL